jgi:hypothetical protein
MLLMSGASLVSVQRLLGHSEITERRYGHLLPDFMAAEGNRLRFGLDRLAPRPSTPGRSAALRSGRTDELRTSLVQQPGAKERGRNHSRFGNDSGLLTGGV